VKNVLIVDVETTGLDRENDKIVELAYCLWSVEHRSIVEAYSTLLWQEKNPAEPFNRISERLLWDEGRSPDLPREIFLTAVLGAQAIVGHQVDFDQAFLERFMGSKLQSTPWICTRDDFEWPLSLTSRHLVDIALRHGVAVTSAHRALSDVLLIAQLFERVRDIAERLERALVQSQKPKADFVATEPPEKNDELKMAGFRWTDNSWKRRMTIEDAENSPFRLVRVET